MAPEVIDRIEFRAGGRQPSQLDLQRSGQAPVALGPLGRDFVEEQDNVPTAPGSADVMQNGVEGHVVVAFRKILPVGTRLNIEHAGQNASGMMLAQDGDAGLLANRHPHGMERWNFIENDRVDKQTDRAFSPQKAVFKPPFA